MRATYGFMADPPLIDQETVTDAEWKAFLDKMMTAEAVARPASPRVMDQPPHRRRPPDHIGSVAVPAGGARPSRSFKLRGGVLNGKVDWHTLTSEILGNERRIWVYTPPGYDKEGAAYPLLVAFDGGASLTNKPIHQTIENLIAERRIRPMVAVFVDNSTSTSRNDELPCSELFATFLETELIPWVRERCHVSSDPADAYVTGVKDGGLAAMWMGFRLPHLFGNVIAQAPSLWWGPGFDMRAVGGAARPLRTMAGLIDQYEASPKLPLRIWQEIGLMEPDDRMIEPNRRMKAVLEAKGYDLTYRETAGGHDLRPSGGETIADALKTMASNT